MARNPGIKEEDIIGCNHLVVEHPDKVGLGVSFSRTEHLFGSLTLLHRDDFIGNLNVLGRI